MKPIINIPEALHRGESQLPFVEFIPGMDIQVPHVNIDSGLWVIRIRFAPGIVLPKHLHTGEVFAFTLSGSWKYLEYDAVNTAGSYLYEPAGSVHTLHVPETNRDVTDVWFAIQGANLNLDADGKVESVWDATFVLNTYLALCEAAGHAKPDVIGA
jgi:quercetin dioxygenase-like cupin family protein